MNGTSERLRDAARSKQGGNPFPSAGALAGAGRRGPRQEEASGETGPEGLLEQQGTPPLMAVTTRASALARVDETTGRRRSTKGSRSDPGRIFC